MHVPIAIHILLPKNEQLDMSVATHRGHPFSAILKEGDLADNRARAQRDNEMRHRGRAPLLACDPPRKKSAEGVQSYST